MFVKNRNFLSQIEMFVKNRNFLSQIENLARIEMISRNKQTYFCLTCVKLVKVYMHVKPKPNKFRFIESIWGLQLSSNNLHKMVHRFIEIL